MTPATEAEEAERLADYDRALSYIHDRVLVNDLSGCWEWQKATSPEGYGVMRWGGPGMEGSPLRLPLLEGLPPQGRAGTSPVR